MDGWEWWNIVGIALQAVGVVVALLGVDRLHRDLLDRSIPDAFADTMRTWWQRWRNRKEPRSTFAEAHVTLRPVTASGDGQASLPAIPTGSVDERIEYLHRILLEVKHLVDQNRRWSDDEDQRIGTEAASALNSLRDELAGVEHRVDATRAAVAGGPDGSGLRFAAGGLAITVLGLTLTLFAGVFG